VGDRVPNENMQLSIAAIPSVLICRVVNTNERSVGWTCHSDSAFFQITSVVVVAIVVSNFIMSVMYVCVFVLDARVA